MAMYLAKVPVTTIQLIGRWKSDAFMRYIREQVDCFTQNVSSQMTAKEHFYTIPDPGCENQLFPPCPTVPTKNKNGHYSPEPLAQVFKALVL
jgi:hypothetical protein